MKCDMMSKMSHESGWAELDAFHMVLGPVFHPASEKGDLAPLKQRAGELADKAGTLSVSAAPTMCASEKTTASLFALASDARELARLVWSGASDDKLKASIAALHDKFEPLAQSCGKGMEMKHQ